MIFDATNCALGEGPLWHSLRGSLIWFDILGMRMFERRENESTAQIWQFDEHVSAAGWMDHDKLLIASETSLFQFDIPSEERTNLADLEAHNQVTRSNDGRADAWGGFWIGTMGKAAEPEAGAIYRFFRGELRLLYDKISISNSICFAADGAWAYFTDTPSQKIYKTALDDLGWPQGEPELFADVTPFKPDGSVVDRAGNLWNAQWGAGRIACYNQKGEFVEAQPFDSPQTSCPAFGGADFTTLFATSAAHGLSVESHENAGRTFCTPTKHRGQQEHQVKLG